MSRNISKCCQSSSGLSNVLHCSRRRYKKIKIIKNKTANQKKSGIKIKNRVKSSNPKTVLGLKNPLQNNNNLLKTSPFNRKKGPPNKNLLPNRRKRSALRLRLKRKSRSPLKVNLTVRDPSNSSMLRRRRLTLSLAQL